MNKRLGIIENFDIINSERDYHYINMTIKYLIKLDELNKEIDKRQIKNIKISKRRLNKLLDKTIYVIIENLANNNSNFNDFLKVYQIKQVPYHEDQFLIKNKENIKILNPPDFYTGNNENGVSNIFSNKDAEFLNSLNRSDGLIRKFSNIYKRGIFYDIYDVDGFLSILTDDNYEFYIDAGDIKKQFVPKNKTCFAVLITHFDMDHYNLIEDGTIVAENYILPYNGSCLFKGKHYYRPDAINIINSFLGKTTLVFMGSPHVTGSKNALVEFRLSNMLTLFFPEKISSNNNLNSICVKIDDKVFYPGDSKFYMFEYYLNNVSMFVAPHHGGEAGSLKSLSSKSINSIVVNTYHKNVNSNIFKNNVKNYYRNCCGLHISKGNTGKRFLRKNIYI